MAFVFCCVRRSTLIGELEKGKIEESDLPQDVLTVLLRNVDHLNLTHEVILREIAFYLLAGAHTSATAFARTPLRTPGDPMEAQGTGEPIHLR